MSKALDDARAVLEVRYPGALEARDVAEPLAALVAAYEALRESLTCPLCGDAPSPQRHASGGRLLSDDEIREIEHEREHRL